MIAIKSSREIDILRAGGRILSGILNELKKMVRPGLNTIELEKKTIELMDRAGGYPSFKNYQTPDGKIFPSALITCINEEIVHAPAGLSRILHSGDIVSIDIGMEYPLKKKTGDPVNKHSKPGGFYTDMSITVPVGKVGKDVLKLLKTTQECLNLAIEQVRPGNYLNDIGQAVQSHAEKLGFGVVRELVGHGVGYGVHEEPHVPNYKIKNKELEDAELKPGMVIAIEPMITMGSWRIKSGPDGHSYSTMDDSLSAHFEHTVAVTDYGHIIITAD